MTQCRQTPFRHIIPIIIHILAQCGTFPAPSSRNGGHAQKAEQFRRKKKRQRATFQLSHRTEKLQLRKLTTKAKHLPFSFMAVE
jgi:hypothetical protein